MRGRIASDDLITGVPFISRTPFVATIGFRALHAIAMDSRGRIFVGDRSNNRIQLFDQEGKALSQWTQFGRPSGIFFDSRDRICVADSESDDVQNPGWEMGIRIGEGLRGWATEFMPFPWADPRETQHRLVGPVPWPGAGPPEGMRAGLPPTSAARLSPETTESREGSVRRR